MFRSISLFSFQKYIGVLNVKGSDTNAAAGYQEREGKQGYSLGQDLKLNQHNSDAFFHGFHKSLSPIAGIAYR
ncbi:hypothetical protein V1264_019717 [Littorina saxatilis]|uniref:Uncharacterized protein n=1 Tax=Littorina saxatilis TaxID=31220 RepID=A0AAN9BFD0_9CAEN